MSDIFGDHYPKKYISFPWLTFKSKGDLEAYDQLLFHERQIRARIVSAFLLLMCLMQLPFLWDRASTPYKPHAIVLHLFSCTLPTAVLLVGTTCFRGVKYMKILQAIMFFTGFVSSLRNILVVAMCHRNVRLGVYLECPGNLIGLVGRCLLYLHSVLPMELKNQTQRPFDTYFLFFWLFGMVTLLQFGFSIEVRQVAKLCMALAPFLLCTVTSFHQIGAFVFPILVLGVLVLVICWRVELSEKSLFLQVKMSKQKSKNMRRMFETANTPIFRLDRSGRFLYCNEVVGQQWWKDDECMLL
jgi:PAS domain-containing protein